MVRTLQQVEAPGIAAILEAPSISLILALWSMMNHGIASQQITVIIASFTIVQLKRISLSVPLLEELWEESSASLLSSVRLEFVVKDPNKPRTALLLFKARNLKMSHKEI